MVELDLIEVVGDETRRSCRELFVSRRQGCRRRALGRGRRIPAHNSRRLERLSHRAFDCSHLDGPWAVLARAEQDPRSTSSIPAWHAMFSVVEPRDE